jgi:hypothetical protein
VEVVAVAPVSRGTSDLQRRIAEGRAEPISDRERAQLREMREIYVRRFGREPDARPADKSR